MINTNYIYTYINIYVEDKMSGRDRKIRVQSAKEFIRISGSSRLLNEKRICSGHDHKHIIIQSHTRTSTSCSVSHCSIVRETPILYLKNIYNWLMSMSSGLYGDIVWRLNALQHFYGFDLRSFANHRWFSAAKPFQCIYIQSIFGMGWQIVVWYTLDSFNC